jgi:hypothetical protein
VIKPLAYVIESVGDRTAMLVRLAVSALSIPMTNTGI